MKPPNYSLPTRILFYILTVIPLITNAQQSLKSVLINHGAASCGSTTAEQNFFVGTVSGTPSLLKTCNNGLSFFRMFVAYNPKERRVYFADISGTNRTRFYKLDYNFTGSITCPAAGSPIYTYNYTILQLCFDHKGNNMMIYNYDGSAHARIKSMDLPTGVDVPGTDKALDFPAGLAPTEMESGDIVILPNSRVFACWGSSPARLYEITNFTGTGNATAVYLANLPKDCFSIAYVDGNLLIGGYNGAGCYYYTWDINSKQLSAAKTFPLGKTTIDMSHMNLGIGVSQELMGSALINNNTADLIYHVYLKNKGTIDLGNVQLKNTLTDVFGVGNVSNVQISIVSNPAGLVLNPNYNGQTDVNMLAAGQSLTNYPVESDSIVIRLQLRATNLVFNKVYKSSAIGTGQLGTGATQLLVSDSSNNGAAFNIDPDSDGVSDDVNENVPTPFIINTILPGSSLQFRGYLQQDKIQLSWQTQQTTSPLHFEVQRSIDGINFSPFTTINANTTTAGNFTTTDNIKNSSTNKLYYRLKINDNTTTYSYSNVIRVVLTPGKKVLSVGPNPFTDQLTIQLAPTKEENLQVIIYDYTGRIMQRQQFLVQPGTNEVTVTGLQALLKGIYIMETVCGSEITKSKLIR